MAKKLKDVNPRDVNCLCGDNATYMCECGCPCCGEDPCAFNCGGAVVPIEEAIDKWPDTELRTEF